MIGNPLISGCQRNIAVERLEPLIHADTGPYIHHDTAGSRRNVVTSSINRLAVYVPGDVIGLPIKAIGMIALRCIKSQIVEILMIAYTVGVVIELHLGSILAKDFNIDLIPRIVLGRSCIGEEGGYYTIILNGLHRGLIISVVIMITGTILRACITVSSLGISGKIQLQRSVGKHCIAAAPYAIKGIAVGPTIRCKEILRAAAAEIIVHGSALVGSRTIIGNLRGAGGSALQDLALKQRQIHTVYNTILVHIGIGRGCTRLVNQKIDDRLYIFFAERTVIIGIAQQGT